MPKTPAPLGVETAAEQAPPRLRLKLTTGEEVRRELARLYREGKSGQRDVSDVSRLANVLSLLSRAIEVEELERRINELEGNP